ncbi:hypothetical protein A5685_14760 [Mycobacterium colombiense]|uniref:Uncharacterized protein n=1 Tax=Mycobacterium colombiense TaxID=339268 RepID=A0A1A2RKZ5_9MYCO|nr:hypothetical protein [Mycobacterium colombiense]OBH52708.1 hypothetical protein A5685_14760 [Mycobacterium colombiense]
MAISFRWLVAIGSVFTSVAPAHAEPAGVLTDPFPDTSLIATWYDQRQPDEFFIPTSPGVWFSTPSGLNCGIWIWGSFGCAGEIPGMGSNHIAWFNGNRAVHYGWTAAIQFPAGQAQLQLPPRSYVTYESTTCAVTPEGNTFCAHGGFKFMLTPTETWVKGWDDRRSYVCNSYGSCPPG